MRFGLLAKFSIAVSLVVVLTTFALTFFLLQVEQLRLAAELKNRAHLHARGLAYNSEYLILSRNFEALRRLIKSSVEEPDIIYVQVLDQNGNLLADERSGPIKEAYNVEGPITTSAADPSRPQEQKARIIGSLKLGVSSAKASSSINQLLLIIALLSSSIIAAGVMSIYLFSRYLLLRPLERFVAATREISRGDLSQRVEIQSRDELGDLALSFNKMTSELAKTKDKLSDHARQLENKVAERTAELEKTVNALKKTTLEAEGAKKDLENKVAELQDFHDAAVGREIKMIELEKEIGRLKKGEGPK